jgi:hypothetical protein
MASAVSALDGSYLSAEIGGVPHFEYPFRKNGDRETAIFQQEYWQRASTFVPSELKVPHETHRDFYLISESEPVDVLPGAGVLRFVRTYAKVPATQTVSASRFIPKPEISGLFPRLINGVMVDKPDDNVAEWTFISQKAITSDSGAPGYGITGGTYTVTFDGDTTSGIAYDADAATLQTALNGLASVIAYGSVVVTGSNTTGFTITWANYTTASADISSLVATDANIFAHVYPVTSASQGMVQRVRLQPIWDDASFSVTSSVTPAGANPLLSSGGGGQLFTFYSYSAAGYDADGGTFTITAYGQTTAAIAWDASLADITAALDLLSEISDRGGAYVFGQPFGVFSFGSISISVLGTPALTSGTFTLTVLGQTTGTIAYNASVATISTAVNALANVTARGGVVVGGDGFANGKQDFTLTFANIPAMTGSGASLTPTGASLKLSTATSQGLVNTLTFTQNSSDSRYLTVATHGVTTADDIYIDSTLVSAGTFTVPDANTIALNSSSGALLTSASTFATVGIANGEVYVADTPNIPVKLITYFYLPGITAGITTVDDIALPARGTTSQLLSAIFTGVTTFNYEVGELTEWRDSPIKMLTITTLNPQHLL